MRRLHALLLGAGLAVAPSSAIADPDNHVDTFESMTVTSRARLGVLVVQLTPELREHFGATKDRGVLVGRVEPKSAAAAAGLHVGDVITEVRSTPVDEAADVIDALASTKAGDKVTVSIVRNNKPLTLTATMRDDARSAFDPAALPKWMRDFWRSWRSPFDDLEHDRSADDHKRT